MNNNKITIDSMKSITQSYSSSGTPSLEDINLFEQAMGSNNAYNVNEQKDNTSKNPAANQKDDPRANNDKSSNNDKNAVAGATSDQAKALLEKLKEFLKQKGAGDINGLNDSKLFEMLSKGGQGLNDELLGFLGEDSAALLQSMMMQQGVMGGIDVQGMAVEDVAAVSFRDINVNEIAQQILASAPTDANSGVVRITLAQGFPGTQISLQRSDEGLLLVNFLASGNAAYQQISNVQESLKRRLEVVEGQAVAIEIADKDKMDSADAERFLGKYQPEGDESF